MAAALGHRAGPRGSSWCHHLRMPTAWSTPIAEVAALGPGARVPVHSDACIGGWTLPHGTYRRRGGAFVCRCRGFVPVSVDLHKYGYAPEGNLPAAVQRRRVPS